MRSNLGNLSRRLSTVTSRQTVRNGWTCQSCRVSQARRKLFSTTTALREAKGDAIDKPYYVTTPIFYVNASPHVGHLYSMLIADILKRWQVLKGRPAILSTGTDEHGMKVQQAAQAQDIQPKALCDTNSETFRDLAKKANIDYDFFIRTTDAEHKEAVEYFWGRLKESGYIYETTHEGWYCVSDETYYPETMIKKRVSPLTGKSFMASVETGNKVEWQSEQNYHFRLTAFKDRLLKLYADNPEFVVPKTRLAEVVNWVTNNLEDLSISRPRSRLEWGIPVPDDPEQVIYVWVDALINYITVAGYPMWPPGSEHTKGWPADVHVVGKDIVRFHSIYWPALLMALDLPLPKTVLSHGHWLMSKKKMSKSVGNVVNPFFAIDRWGVDTIRYFLIYHGSITEDSDYSNEFIVINYKKGLQHSIGNLLNRITQPKQWSVRDAVVEICGKPSDELPDLVISQKQMIEELVSKVEKHMDALNPTLALKAIIDVAFASNVFMSNAKPWDVKNESETTALNQIVFHTSEALRVVGILLQPFIPEKSKRLLDVLGVSPDRRTFEFAKLHADNDYGTSFVPIVKGAQGSLFPPLPVED
ncbi:tRNA synthetases class I (M)-domain-containing protein [Annulohypoxylon maeteangense]|uniref:tRNA synthetases class I (M)-domain-containing protein n=1 Tax=Annulohypoxylon maeteangense TaxID=1927788 RepID=UPI0020087DE0|nr:tRNA synthetases class I (M)-domain-containing protein [Annulohypoxylon maeteangense]KAI0883196.1 tRNA synthetases class I (M)-domain-containing protein [Annulohypoxylon maeteangense]